MLDRRTLRAMRNRWQKDLDRLQAAYVSASSPTMADMSNSEHETVRNLATAIAEMDGLILTSCFGTAYPIAPTEGGWRMTLWERIVGLITVVKIGLTADSILVLTAQIRDAEYHMSIAEMADDRYYTNGRRDRDKAALHKLKSELKRLTESK